MEIAPRVVAEDESRAELVAESERAEDLPHPTARVRFASRGRVQCRHGGAVRGELGEQVHVAPRTLDRKQLAVIAGREPIVKVSCDVRDGIARVDANTRRTPRAAAHVGSCVLKAVESVAESAASTMARGTPRARDGFVARTASG